MNISAKGLLIETTVLVWRIAEDLPNPPNFPTIQYWKDKLNYSTHIYTMDRRIMLIFHLYYAMLQCSYIKFTYYAQNYAQE